MIVAARSVAWQVEREGLQMLTLALHGDVERRLTDLAKSRGLSEADIARELIEASLDDIEDVQMAVQRIEAGGVALTSQEARKALGLDG